MKVMEAGKPRIIRSVMSGSLNRRTGRYKRAKDRRTQVVVERITSLSVRPCDNKQCIYPYGMIGPKTEYVRVVDPKAPHRRFGKNVIPETRDYHPDCVPARALRLVRFVVPMDWVATSCTEWRGPTTRRRFTSPEAWLLFTDKHFPSMREEWSSNADITKPPPYQIGTGYNWSQLFRV